MRWARMTMAVALCTVGMRAQASGICPDDALLIPRATVRLGHGTAWPEHVETIGAFCMDRDEFSAARFVECLGSGACFPSPSCSTAQGAVACLDAGVREWTATPGPSAFSVERMVKGAFCVYPVWSPRNR